MAKIGVDIPRDEYLAFKQAIKEIETPSSVVPNPNQRTFYDPTNQSGSTAFGRYQITRTMLDDILSDAGMSVSATSQTDPSRYGKKILSFSYDPKKNKGGYTDEERSVLAKWFDAATEANRIGGKDRKNIESQYSTGNRAEDSQMEAYLDLYDYPILRTKNPRERNRGTYGFSSDELEIVDRLQEKKLGSFYEDLRDQGVSLDEIARRWHGGANWAKSKTQKDKTIKYGEKFNKLFSGFLEQQDFGMKESFVDPSTQLPDPDKIQLIDINLPGFQDGGLVDPRVGFGFALAPEGAKEEDYDLYQTPTGRIFGVPIGTEQPVAANLGLNLYREDYESAYNQLLSEQQPAPVQEEPGLMERFGGELLSSLREQLTSSPGAVMMTLGDILDDEELYKAGLAKAEENQRKAAEYTPFEKVSFQDIDSAYKGTEFVAQTIGQTGGFWIPSAAAGVGATLLAGASLPITGTIAGISLLGGAAFLTYSNLLSNQLERNASVARAEGRDPSTKEFNIANQLLAAGAQTALEYVVPAGVAKASGLIKGASTATTKPLIDAIAEAGGNAAVRNASNTAAAQTVMQVIRGNAGRTALNIAKSSGAEGLTETAQSLIERAAAGETIDPREQAVFDEAIESFAAGAVGGAGFGGAGEYIQARRQVKRNKAEAEEEAKKAAEAAEIDQAAEPLSPDNSKIDEARRILEQNAIESERLEKERILQRELSKEAELGLNVLESEADQAAMDQAEAVAATNRTTQDVFNAAKSRNLDLESSPTASFGFSRFVYDVTSRKKRRGQKPVYSLEDASPEQIDDVYSAIESLPEQEASTTFPVLSINESIEIAAESRKKKPKAKKPKFKADKFGIQRLNLAKTRTKDQLVNQLKPLVRKRLGKNADQKLIDKAAATAVDNLISVGIINPTRIDAPTQMKGFPFVGELEVYEDDTPVEAMLPGQRKPRKKKLRRFALNEDADIESLLDPDFRLVAGSILQAAKADQSTARVSSTSVASTAGTYPSYRQAANILPGLDRETYERAKALYQELGIITSGKTPRIIPSESAVASRIAYEPDAKPQTRWVVRDQSGNFVRAEPSKSKAQKFIDGNKNKGLLPPTRERGYGVKEVQYRDDLTGKESISQSKVVNFIPTDVYEEVEVTEVEGTTSKTVGDDSIATDREADDAAMTQRGEPESVMNYITVKNNPGFPSRLTDLLMQVGDLSHRVQEREGLGMAALGRKINAIIRLHPSFGYKSIRKEIEDARFDNAERNVLYRIPEFKRLDTEDDANGNRLWQSLYETRSEFYDDYRRNISEEEIQQEIQRGRDAEVEPLASYKQAHQDYNRPVTEMGQIGKEMAIDLAEGKYEDVYEKAKIFKTFLDRYIDLESRGEFEQAEKLRLKKAPVATSPSALTQMMTSKRPKPKRKKKIFKTISQDAPAYDAQLEAQQDAASRAEALAASASRFFGTTQEQLPNVTPQLLQAIEATRTKRRKGVRQAAQIFREAPLSIGKVVDSYMMGVSPESNATSTVMSNDSWTMPYSATSQLTGENIPVVVKEGTINRNSGRGFGRKKLNVRDGQISRATPYSGFREALTSFFDRIRSNPKVLSSPEVSVFAEGPGRSIVIWNNESFSEPLTIVLDYIQDDSGDYFSVFDMFVGNDFGAQVENIEIKKNIPNKRGRNVSTQAVLAAENPKAAIQMTQAEREVDSFGLSTPEIEAQQLGIRKREPTGAVKYINKVMNKVVGKERMDKIQQLAFDQWDSWVLAEQQLVNKALQRAMFADQSAVSMVRNLDNLMPMFQESLGKGYVALRDGILTIERMDLDNSTGETLVTYYDPDARVVRSRAFNANMYNEQNKNTQGGLVTILSALKGANFNYIPDLFNYVTALRAYRVMAENQNRPAKDRIRTPYDKNINLLKEHLSAPHRHPEVAVAHHNLQKWNKNTVQFLVDSGVLDPEAADFWTKHNDYIPFYLNLDNETNKLIEREWNTFQAKRGKRGQMFNPLTYNDPTTPLKKGSSDLADPFESYLSNTVGALTAGSVNLARSRVIRDLLAQNRARRVERNDRGNPNIVRIRDNGEDIFFEVDDAYAFQLSSMVEQDPLSEVFDSGLAKLILANPAQFLRETVTRDPGFSLANVIRDSMIVWLVNPEISRKNIGLGIVPEAIRRALSSESESREILKEGGISRGPTATGFDADFYTKDKKGKAIKNIKQQVGAEEKKNGVLRRVWDNLGQLSSQSESATREIVYEHVFNTTREQLRANKAREMLPEETNEQFEDRISRIARAEGIEQAREILNFNRRGSNPYIQKLLSAVPFANASLQGLNVLFRAHTGFRPVGISRNATEEEVFNNIIRRGMTVAAASVALELLNIASGVDDWDEQDEYKKNKNFMIPLPGGGYAMIPGAFEYHFIYSAIPRLITRAVVDQLAGDKRDDTREAYKATMGILGTMGVDFPPLAKLAYSYLSNRSSFGNYPIDYEYERTIGTPAEERVNARTTSQSQLISNVVAPLGRLMGLENLSPNQIDNAVNTLAGGLAGDAWSALDMALRMPSVISSTYPYRMRPVPRLESLPLLNRFYADSIGSNEVNAFYDMRSEIMRLEAQIRDLQADRNYERARQVIKDNKELLSLSPAAKQVYNSLRVISKEIKDIESGEREMGMIEGRRRVEELQELRRRPIGYWKDIIARSREAR